MQVRAAHLGSFSSVLISNKFHFCSDQWLLQLLSAFLRGEMILFSLEVSNLEQLQLLQHRGKVLTTKTLLNTGNGLLEKGFLLLWECSASLDSELCLNSGWKFKCAVKLEYKEIKW